MSQIKMWAVFNVNTRQVLALFQWADEAYLYIHQRKEKDCAVTRQDIATLHAAKDRVFLPQVVDNNGSCDSCTQTGVLYLYRINGVPQEHLCSECMS